jgi:galactokinase
VTAADRAERPEGDKARLAFHAAFGSPPTYVTSAPGRVNLIGEHTDYNDGWVLPMAIDRRAWLAVRPCNSLLVTLRALDLGEQVTFRLTDLDSRLDLTGLPLPAWALYPAGVASAMQRAGQTLVGLDAVLASDVPIGAGLSSSAAIEVAFALAWDGLSRLDLDRLTLAQLCRRAENDYVAVQSGLMDPFTALHAAGDSALLLDCRSLEWSRVSIPPSLAVVVADSGIRRSLGASVYNQRREECAEASRRLAQVLPGVSTLRDVTPEQLDEAGDRLTAALRRRAEHVIQENRRVLAAAECLRKGEAARLGSILREGHASLRDLFEVSHPAVDTLVELAGTLPGCYGARLTGGGFGGSTVNLVESSGAERFAGALVALYQEATGRRGQAWVCRPGDQAAMVRLDPPSRT